MDNSSFEALFKRGLYMIFAFFGYCWSIQSKLHGRANEAGFRAVGSNDEGTTTTAIDMVVLNRDAPFRFAGFSRPVSNLSVHASGRVPAAFFKYTL
jgi:xylulose-5-phosphate/fructose-6-phosphate phosphoketolase